LTNAIQFNHEAGLVRVTARGERGSALLTVADTGPGIAPRIFRISSSGSTASTRPAAETGRDRARPGDREAHRQGPRGNRLRRKRPREGQPFLDPDPPLRDRIKEISAISEYILEEHSKKMKINKVSISDNVLALLKSYWWPGNLTELEQVIIRSAIFSEGGI
jgi:hypothetical protein